MRTSSVTFNSSFFEPFQASDAPGTSRPAGEKQEQKPLIYSPEEHGGLDKFIASAAFEKFQGEYTEVLKSIKAFVHDHAGHLDPPLSEERRKKVNAEFDALEKRLFGMTKGAFDTPVAQANMYQTGKKIFHEFAALLQDKNIHLRNRMDAVLTLTDRIEHCFGGITSDVSDLITGLVAYKCGMKGRAQQWKIKMLDALILQYVEANHEYMPGEEIHFVNAYYNHLASEMGVAQREDYSASNYQGNICPQQLADCRESVLAQLKPARLAEDTADHYRSRIEEFLGKENIEADRIDEDGFELMKTAMRALKPEYGDVSTSVLVEPDPDTYQLSYIGRQHPVKGTRHFLKTFRKLGVIDYDKQSKVVLGKTEDGIIAMRDDLFWVKEGKHAPVYECTASSLLKLAPEELLANMEKAEPVDMQARSSLLRKVIHHIHGAGTAAVDTGEQLDVWLRDFAAAMKERPSWPQGWSDPVMLLAASFGRASALHDLLEAGGDKNAANEDHKTLLMLAAQGGHVETVNVLLEKEVDIEARDQEERTALMWAAGTGHAKVAEALLGKGADIEATDQDGKTALIWAAGMGHAGVVEALFNEGANIKAKDQDERTALIWAAGIMGHAEAAAALLEKGADTEAKDLDGYTALIWAAAKGYAEAAAALLDKEANTEARDVDGRTALIWAAEQGHTAVAAALLGKAANTEAEDSHENTPLILAAVKGHAEVVEALLDKNANTEARNRNGKTALIIAAESGDAKTVTALLGKGANAEVTDPLGYTPLILALMRGHVGVAESLLENGVDIEARDPKKERTALIWAATKGHASLVAALLKKGADTEAMDLGGKTALMRAAAKGHAEVAALLEEASGQSG